MWFTTAVAFLKEVCPSSKKEWIFQGCTEDPEWVASTDVTGDFTGWSITLMTCGWS
jgi:hypothetical protein